MQICGKRGVYRRHRCCCRRQLVCFNTELLLPDQVRDGVLYMLDAWLAVSSAATLFPAVADAVANPKTIADGKVAGLGWLAKAAAEGKAGRALEPALRAAAVGAADKATQVREAAAALATELMRAEGEAAVAAAAGGMGGGADKKAASDLVAKVATGAGGPSSRPATASASSAPAAPVAPAAAAAPRPATTRAAISRPGTAAAAPAPVHAAAPSEPAAPILSLSDAVSKAARAQRFRPRPGRFDGLNAEEIENLQREMAAVASPEWQALLFHKDFRQHLAAADQVGGPGGGRAGSWHSDVTGVGSPEGCIFDKSVLGHSSVPLPVRVAAGLAGRAGGGSCGQPGPASALGGAPHLRRQHAGKEGGYGARELCTAAARLQQHECCRVTAEEGCAACRGRC